MNATAAYRTSLPASLKSNRRRPIETCPSCLVRRHGLCSPLRDAGEVLALEAAHLPPRAVKAGDVLYHQGDAGDRIQNVISGWVCLYHDLSDGRRSLLRVIVPGGMFGAIGYAAAQPHTGAALTNAVICSIPLRRFDELREAHPQLTDQLIWMIDREARLAQDELATARLGSAEAKLAHLLWSLAVRSLRRRPRPGERIWIPLTQRHLGAAAGLTPVHVNRLLRRWRESGLLDFRSPWLDLRQPDGLESAAGVGEEFLTAWTSPDASRWDPSARAALDA